MRCGISTACFYPLSTLRSLQLLADAGVPCTEIFLNTFSELDASYVRQLEQIKRAGSIDVVSIHPFSSMLDGFFFASEYATRFTDGMDLYHRYFELCAALGADKLVFHGDHAHNERRFSAQRYAENCVALAEAGRPYGVTLCYENVAYCRLGRPETVRALRPLLGQTAAFVLDLKQLRRANDAAWQDMLAAMAGAVRHVHISDAAPGQDCLPPGTGNFDFPALIAALRAAGYEGDLIIELYRDNFGDLPDLMAAREYITQLI